MAEREIYEIIRNDAIRTSIKLQKAKAAMRELKNLAKEHGYKINEDTGEIEKL